MPSLFRTVSFVVMFSAMSLAVFPVMAQLNTINNAGDLGLASGGTGAKNKDLYNKGLDIMKWLLGFLGLVAVVVIVYGGVQYILSAGDEKKAEVGKRTVIFAMIGLVLVGISAVIVNSVLSLLT